MMFRLNGIKFKAIGFGAVIMILVVVSATVTWLITDAAWNAMRRARGERAVPDAHERLVFQNIYKENEKEQLDQEREPYYREREAWDDAVWSEKKELSRLYHPFEFSRFHKQSWNWEYLEKGDHALVVTICTSFEREFLNTFNGKYNIQIEVSPEREKVVNVILERLFEDLAKVGVANARDIVTDIADFVSLKYGEPRVRHRFFDGVYHWTDSGPSIDVPFTRQRIGALTELKERQRWESAIRLIPQAYAFYFESLVSERGEAVRMMDKLIALESEHSGKLRAIAKYRRARLLMCMEDWDVLSDAEAKARIRAVKQDLRDVRTHVDQGALNPSKMAESAPYWIAHCESMLLRPDRLVRIGEADFAGAFRTYLAMPQLDCGNAVNSSRWLAAHLASSKEVVKCATDPLLRELITLYYLSLSQSYYSFGHLSVPEGKHLQSLWLDAIGREASAAEFSPAKVALMQYQVGRWTDCFVTAGFLPKSHPLRALLRSRCVLRLAGDTALARKITDAGLGIGTDDYALPKRGAKSYDDDVDDAIYVNLADHDTLRARLQGERAMLALSQGEFNAAYQGFHRSGSQKDAEYVGECLLTTNELRQCVLTMTPSEIEFSPQMDPEHRKELNPMEHLISKLFRDGRTKEALAYMKSPQKERTELYLKLLAIGEDEGLDRRARASAYWRATTLASHLGRRIFRSPVGADHSMVFEGWYMPYYFLPWMRYTQGLTAHELRSAEDPPSLNRKKLLFADEEFETNHPKLRLMDVSDPELRRVTQWMGTHLVRDKLAERDPDYEVMRLSLMAVRLLPDNDHTGADMLQHVGRMLKYKDPKGAEPAYRVLATRFKGTNHGGHAFKRKWLSDEYPQPDNYVLEER